MQTARQNEEPSGVVRLETPSGVVLEERRDPDDEQAHLELRAPDGTLVVEYRPGDGTCRIHAPRVEVRADVDLDLAAGRDLRLTAQRDVRVRSGESELRVEPERVRIDAKSVEAVAEEASWTTTLYRLSSEQIETESRRLVQRVGELEVNARRLVERVRDSYREAEGLAQTKAGRVRLVAEDTLWAFGRRALMKAREDMQLRGKRIYLD